MRNDIRFLALSVLMSSLAFGQCRKIESSNLLEHPFQVDFPSGSQLKMYFRSGDFQVFGTNDNKITVRVNAKDWEKARQVKARFEQFDGSAVLNISGGLKNHTQITVEVPRSTGVFVRMPAVQLEIAGITGDKGVQLHAGELIIGVGDPADYSHVDVSISTGGLEATPFGEEHGGLVRSFQKTGSGTYKLHAHVGAGDLTLR